MTLPIKELGGLTDAEIQLRISEANEKQAQMLEEKLANHTEAIDKRLATTDQAVREVGKQYADLKADVAVLVASDRSKKEMLQSILDRGDSWHDADIEFRAVLIQRVSKIEVEQNKLAEQMKLLQWMAAISSSTAKIFAYIMGTENFRFYVVAGLIFLFLRSIVPNMLPHILHIFHTLK